MTIKENENKKFKYFCNFSFFSDFCYWLFLSTTILCCVFSVTKRSKHSCSFQRLAKTHALRLFRVIEKIRFCLPKKMAACVFLKIFACCHSLVTFYSFWLFQLNLAFSCSPSCCFPDWLGSWPCFHHVDWMNKFDEQKFWPNATDFCCHK